MKLNLLREHGNTHLKEVGSPRDFWQFEERGVVALCASYSLNNLEWDEYPFLLDERLAIYDFSNASLIAVWDKCPYLIADVAIHPSEPIALIATGAYDGGYFCDGNAYLWNWITGENKQIFEYDVFVSACRFADNGANVDFLLHPQCDGQIERKDCVTVFLAYSASVKALESGLKPNLNALPSVQPQELGFLLRPPGASYDPQPAINKWLGGGRKSVKHRSAIVGLRYLKSGQLIALGSCNALEVWDLEQGSSDPLRPATPHARVGRKIFKIADRSKALAINSAGDYPLSHSTEIATYTSGESHHTVCERLQGEYLFCSSADSSILGFDVWRRSPPVLVQLTQEHISAREIETSKFASVLMKVMFTSATRHLFIRQTRKKLDFYGETEQLQQDMAEFIPEELFEYFPDEDKCVDLWIFHRSPEYQIPIQSGVALELHDTSGNGFIAGLTFASHVVGLQPKYASCLARYAASDGTLIWNLDLARQGLLDILHIESLGVVAASLSNGEILVVDACTGEVRLRQALTFSGVPSLATCLDFYNDRLAVGTMEGRVAEFELVR